MKKQLEEYVKKSLKAKLVKFMKVQNSKESSEYLWKLIEFMKVKKTLKDKKTYEG